VIIQIIRKNEAVEFLDDLRKSGWMEREMESFISLLMMVFQSEANILSEVTEIVLNAKVQIKGVPIAEIGEHFILEPFEPNVRLPPYLIVVQLACC
jgi:hypothetical protein